MQENDVQNLIKQAQNGDSAAFGEIYDEYSQRLFNFLFSKLANREVAEDLLQTVFLKAWTNLASYRPRSSAKFSTWLYQIANFTLIDHWRTRKPTVELTEVENLTSLASEDKLYENYDFLWQALSRLPLTYQTVLELRFRQELTVEETAYVMRKSPIGVRVLQHRALKALKKELGDKS